MTYNIGRTYKKIEKTSLKITKNCSIDCNRKILAKTIKLKTNKNCEKK